MSQTLRKLLQQIKETGCKLEISKLHQYIFSLNTKRLEQNSCTLQDKLIEFSEHIQLSLENTFLNMTFKNSFLKQIIEEWVNFQPIRLNKKIMVDYGGVNVGKPCHFGNLRSFLIGDAIYKLLKTIGYEVKSDIHLGDIGSHVNIIVEALLEHTNFTDIAMSEILDIYVKRSKDVSHHEKKILKILQNYMQSQQLHGLEDEKIVAAYKHVKSVSVKNIEVICQRLDFKFDFWLGESDAIKTCVEIEKILLESGILKTKDQALVFTDDESVFKRSDGTYLYIGTDIGTIYQRLMDGYEIILYVVDKRQGDHFQKLFNVTEKICKILNKKTPQLLHVGFGIVTDENGQPLKTRAGNFDSFLSELESIRREIAKEQKILDPEAVSINLFKSINLIYSHGSNMSINVQKCLNVESNNGGLYLMYTSARLFKLTKLEPGTETPSESLNEDLKEIEIEAVKLIVYIEQYAIEFQIPQVHAIFQRIMKLSQKINAFYQKHKIKDLIKDVIDDLTSIYRVLQKSVNSIGLTSFQEF